jgi:hypothetical protein
MSAEKTEKPRVSKEKEALLKTIQSLGLKTDGLTEDQLFKKVVEELNKTNQRLVSEMSTDKQKSLNMFSGSVDHNITNSELLERLFDLNMPNFYLHLFRDDDMELSNEELWQIVNESGINPYVSVKDLFKQKKDVTAAKKAKRRFKRG